MLAHLAQAFVEFKDASGAAQARERINGRMFAGSMVTVVYISQQEYDTAKAAAASGGAKGAAAADAAAAAVAAVGLLVDHGSPSPDRREGGRCQGRA
jgi:hypothetical protein